MYKSLKLGYLFSEPIYYMLRLSKHFVHRIRATREHFKSRAIFYNSYFIQS